MNTPTNTRTQTNTHDHQDEFNNLIDFSSSVVHTIYRPSKNQPISVA